MSHPVRRTGGVAAQARRWGAAAADGFPAKEVRRRLDMPQRADKAAALSEAVPPGDKAAALAEAVAWAAGSRASGPLRSAFATNAMARAAGWPRHCKDGSSPCWSTQEACGAVWCVAVRARPPMYPSPESMDSAITRNFLVFLFTHSGGNE